jgi:hypothetical protein
MLAVTLRCMAYAHLPCRCQRYGREASVLTVLSRQIPGAHTNVAWAESEIFRKVCCQELSEVAQQIMSIISSSSSSSSSMCNTRNYSTTHCQALVAETASNTAARYHSARPARLTAEYVHPCMEHWLTLLWHSHQPGTVHLKLHHDTNTFLHVATPGLLGQMVVRAILTGKQCHTHGRTMPPCQLLLCHYLTTNAAIKRTRPHSNLGNNAVHATSIHRRLQQACNELHPSVLAVHQFARIQVTPFADYATAICGCYALFGCYT